MTIASKALEDPAENFRWTVATFYRAEAGGVFDDSKQWEVVDSEVLEKETLNPPNASLLRLISRIFRAAIEPRFLILPGSPLHLSEESDPTSAIYVVRGSEDDYLARHSNASEVHLLIEVAARRSKGTHPRRPSFMPDLA